MFEMNLLRNNRNMRPFAFEIEHTSYVWYCTYLRNVGSYSSAIPTATCTY